MPESLKESVRSRALELGFDDCRFTSPAPPDHIGHYREWIQKGWHGEMAYLDRHTPKKERLTEILPDVRTVISLAISYHDSSFEPVSGKGQVARYAHHLDYHEVLQGPLRELTRFVDQLEAPETRSLAYVDAGPILERDLAMRAGLGFAGKHTNLIHRRLGNWFFIAEILTPRIFEQDAAERNHCGSCSRCLQACPTGALPAPFQLDARRCISYLTIELKGSIPEDLRPLIGDHLFGCDDCLQACPWNRFAREGALMKDFRQSQLQSPDLLMWLALDSAGFKKLFAGTPMLRTKRRGLLRNICVVLGNTAGPEALGPLENATNDPEPLVAEHAHWAIQQILKRQKQAE